MDDGDRLLQAVLDDPGDDAPRLVLADWLEERGDPRGEFIRVQVALAPVDVRARGGRCNIPTHRCTVCAALWTEWPDGKGWSLASAACGECCDNQSMGEQVARLGDDVVALFRREWDLLSAHALLWVNGTVPDARPSNWSPHNPTPYLVLPGPEFVNVEFRRGFVDAVTLPTQAFLDHAEALFAAQPVTRVTLSDKRPPSRAWQGSDEWGWFKGGYNAAWPSCPPDELPEELWDLLLAGRVYGWWKYYRSEPLAAAAISNAAVAFGRAARLSRACGPPPAPSPRPARRRTRS